LKQGLLITAYKNPDHLLELIGHMDKDFYFFIHIDKKSKIEEADIIKLKNSQNVILLSRKFKINWGGLNHLKAILLLVEAALKTDVSRMHLISGHDFPIKTSVAMKAFNIQHYEKEFIEAFELPTPGWSNGGLERLLYYHFYDQFNAKSSQVRIIRFLINFQKKMQLKRPLKISLPKLYGGSTWWSLSAPCLKYVIDYTKANPSFLKRFKYTFCSEEIFFQSIIMNSPFRRNVVNDNLRHISWIKKNGNCPANLDETDYDNLMGSGKLFARRFEYPVSRPLLKMITQHMGAMPIDGFK
jgi:hypothetical protein